MIKNILLYDSSFEGFLTAVFEVFELKLTHVIIQNKDRAQDTFFDTLIEVHTDEKKAARVWRGVQKKASKSGCVRLYKAFLSEIEGVENLMLSYIKLIFSSGYTQEMDSDFSNETILQLSKIEKKINREKHRMDAFIRFKLTKDGIYFATIEPDFNVLPLNIKHFKNRYADQKWLIYDLKRKYGAYYNLIDVETVQLEISHKNTPADKSIYFDDTEMDYQALWQNYFKSTNIPSRKNMRLHLQHVPRRYWKYLSEKQPAIKK